MKPFLPVVNYVYSELDSTSVGAPVTGKAVFQSFRRHAHLSHYPVNIEKGSWLRGNYRVNRIIGDGSKRNHVRVSLMNS